MTTTNLLRFEAAHPGHPPGKETLIRDMLGISAARYYQLLHRAVQSREGIAADPLTARMVRERLNARARRRIGYTVGYTAPFSGV